MGLSKEGSSKTVDDFQSQTSQQSISHKLELYIVCAVDDFKNSELDLSYKLFLTTRNRGLRFVDCFIPQEYVLKLSSVELWKLT